MRKKEVICPHCHETIILNVKSKGCVEVDTSFLHDEDEQEVAELLKKKGYEFGIKR